MAGTQKGGQAAAASNRARHGSDFYARIGAMGGQKGRTGGFASKVVGKDGLTGAERAKLAGEAGGRKSRRRKAATVATQPQVSDDTQNQVAA